MKVPVIPETQSEHRIRDYVFINGVFYFHDQIGSISLSLKLKDSTDIDKSTSYLDMHLKIDSEGRRRTKLYYKRDDFNFLIVNLYVATFQQHLHMEYTSLS